MGESSNLVKKSKSLSQHGQRGCEPCRSFGHKCSNLVKKQRAKFYILRRCIAMLVCWHDRDPGES